MTFYSIRFFEHKQTGKSRLHDRTYSSIPAAVAAADDLLPEYRRLLGSEATWQVYEGHDREVWPGPSTYYETTWGVPEPKV